MINQDRLTPENKTLLSAIRPGMKLTKIDISEMMATTCKVEFTVHEMLGEPMFRPHYQAATFGKVRIGSYKPPRKRSAYYLDLDSDTLLFEGWDLPVKTDHELPQRDSSGGASFVSFSGNAMLNLWAESISVLKDWIEHRNLNPFFTDFDHVIYVTPPTSGIENVETFVYTKPMMA